MYFLIKLFWQRIHERAVFFSRDRDIILVNKLKYTYLKLFIFMLLRYVLKIKNFKVLQKFWIHNSVGKAITLKLLDFYLWQQQKIFLTKKNLLTKFFFSDPFPISVLETSFFSSRTCLQYSVIIEVEKVFLKILRSSIFLTNHSICLFSILGKFPNFMNLPVPFQTSIILEDH